MGRVSAAFRVFFKTLFDAGTASQVERLLTGEPVPPAATAAPVAPPPKPQPAPPQQNPAVTLLAALQREARLVDFLQEDIAPYTDEQIGAAVREIHRDAAKLIARWFALRPVVTEAEGASVEIPAGFDAGRYRLTGKVEGTAPYRGAVRHHGWEASKCELPTYTGATSSALTIAPAEVEVGAR